MPCGELTFFFAGIIPTNSAVIRRHYVFICGSYEEKLYSIEFIMWRCCIYEKNTPNFITLL